MIGSLLQVLWKMGLLSPLGLFSLISTIYTEGINLMVLVRLAEKKYGNKIALVSDKESFTYSQLAKQCEVASIYLKNNYHIGTELRVAFLCKNHHYFVQSIFAVSRLGANIYLLNPDISKNQFKQLVDAYNFDLYIHDEEAFSLIDEHHLSHQAIISNFASNINENIKMREVPLKKSSKSSLVLLTGGTTGTPKEAIHKPSILNYLNPFLTLLKRLKLMQYQTAYIATPLYHGYGIAILLTFIALGKKTIISENFRAEKSSKIISEHKVEVITVVPLMIHKLLQVSSNDLSSLQCIASGGAKLNAKLIAEVNNKLGQVLYNLYGTSEAGLNIIATPQDLQYSSYTIGRLVKGVRLQTIHNGKPLKEGQVGQLCIKNKWSMKNKGASWIETGDLGYRDPNGYYFLCGRTDDLVISAGVNIYPIEVEQVLILHPSVEEVAIVGIPDEQYGQRLVAYVELKSSTEYVTKDILIEWLSLRVSRLQLPKEIVFVDQLPYTALGKLNKKQLA